MTSINRPRHAVICCLTLLCLVNFLSVCSSVAAVAAVEEEDSGDLDINVKDYGIIEDEGDTNIDGAADSVVDENLKVEAADKNNAEAKNLSSASDESIHGEESKTREDILLGETIGISNNLDLDLGDSSKGQDLQYTPPTHFQITAHVQTNLHTGLSYFLPKESSFAHLPFLECGAIGSTTESLPLVSGVFRHVPHTALVPKRDEATMDVVLENLDQVIEKEDVRQTEDGTKLDGLDILEEDEDDIDAKETNNSAGNNSEGMDSGPKRPSPPKYVVALSSMEITVGGDGNETQTFHPGDVIFIEDTWWGVWDNEEDDIDSLDTDGDVASKESNADDAKEEAAEETQDADNDGNKKMKGYIMRASSETETDLNVLMLTVPNAIHRHWKNAQYAMAMAKREEQRVANQQKQQSPSSQHGTLNTGTNEFGTRRPWWKMPTAFLNKKSSSSQQDQALPKPCSLESDPAFAHPSAMSSTTLSQHFTQHFTGLLRRSTNPHPSFLPHHHQDLLLPIVAQTAAAMIGGAASLALVLQLWRIIPGPIAVGFGSACLIGLGTWGIVWLGEEILDQWELWRERRRLERMMSEGWGKGGSTAS